MCSNEREDYTQFLINMIHCDNVDENYWNYKDRMTNQWGVDINKVLLFGDVASGEWEKYETILHKLWTERKMIGVRYLQQKQTYSELTLKNK